MRTKTIEETAAGAGEAAQRARNYLAARQLGITVEKLHEMQNYALTLRKKFPHMKPDRIKRKVAEYFKIKLT
jgi:hypothetical protein